jgi:hypothetical protein
LSYHGDDEDNVDENGRVLPSRQTLTLRSHTSEEFRGEYPSGYGSTEQKYLGDADQEGRKLDTTEGFSGLQKAE